MWLYFLAQSFLTFATPWTVAIRATLSLGLYGQEHWSVLPFPSPGDLRHRDQAGVFCNSCTADGFFTTEPPEKKWSEVKVASLKSRIQLFATPWTVHGILQARILEWVDFPFTWASSQTRNWTQVSLFEGRFFTSWATSHLGSQFIIWEIHKWLTKTFIYFLPTSSYYSGLTEC